MTVNHDVVGSSPTAGVSHKRNKSIGPLCSYLGELSEWPKEHDWKSCRRVFLSQGFESLTLRNIFFTGPLVKRLRHRPFTAVTRVRVPYGSFILIVTFLFGGLAQLGEHLPYKQGVSGSIPLTSITRLVPWCRG